MESIVIAELEEFHPGEFVELLDAATAEGIAMMQRLVDDHASGINGFDRPGEVLLAAREETRILGVCGVNRNPFGGGLRTGRVRRMYVLPSHRSRGIGRELLAAVVRRATDSFDALVLRTNTTAGAAFYVRCGFTPITNDPDATHELQLG
jgi:GNAT superfamily N-acetyltransferase